MPRHLPHPPSVPQVYAPSRTVVVYAPSEYCDPQVPHDALTRLYCRHANEGRALPALRGATLAIHSRTQSHSILSSPL